MGAGGTDGVIEEWIGPFFSFFSNQRDHLGLKTRVGLSPWPGRDARKAEIPFQCKCSSGGKNAPSGKIRKLRGRWHVEDGWRSVTPTLGQDILK